MKRLIVFSFFLLLLLPSIIFAREMLVRVFVDSYTELKPLGLKTINPAGVRYGEYYDIILTEQEYYANLIPSGLPYEVIYEDLTSVKQLERGSYHSYAQVVQLMRNMAQTYSNICRFDSVGQTYYGEWIYCVIISDNPGVEDPTEPDVLIMGCHHAREWATVEVPLFFADSLTKAYSSNSSIQAMVNSREIWVIPVVNVDGYNYDYPSHNMWRKNRQPYAGYTGTDPNRTYNGCCNGDRYGDWGSIPYYSAVTHHPNNDLYCGPHGDGPDGNSAPCDDAIVQLVKSHEFNYTESYHSYGELVLWSWGYTSSNPPNNSYLVSYGSNKANLIHRLGSGYYTPQQASSLYPTSGDTDGWIYGWYHYVNGTNCISFTTEVGTSFYQSVSDLDYICRQNFKGFFYMLQETENIRNNLDCEVPAPVIALLDTSYTGDYTVSWSPLNQEHNNPTKWELHELTGFSSFTDDLESGSGHWVLQGFSSSTARYHSSNHSFFSGSGNNICNTATTVYPYIVESGDSVTFWCWYYLETNYDVATVEVSVDGMEWLQLVNSYTGSQQSWQRKSYSLQSWVGKSIFIRFRAMTDDNTLREGFYVDDISPTPDFSNEVTISNSVTDTFYSFTNKPDGQYWYKVRGSNTAYGWGSYSVLEDIIVHFVAVAEEKEKIQPFTFSLFPNPSRGKVTFKSSFPEKKGKIKIYSVAGSLVKTLDIGNGSINWNRRDSRGMRLPAGIYYIRLQSGSKNLNKKLILLD